MWAGKISKSCELQKIHQQLHKDISNFLYMRQCFNNSKVTVKSTRHILDMRRSSWSDYVGSSLIYEVNSRFPSMRQRIHSRFLRRSKRFVSTFIKWLQFICIFYQCLVITLQTVRSVAKCTASIPSLRCATTHQCDVWFVIIGTYINFCCKTKHRRSPYIHCWSQPFWKFGQYTEEKNTQRCSMTPRTNFRNSLHSP